MEEIFFRDVDTREEIQFSVIDRVEISNQLYLLTIETACEDDLSAQCYIMKAIQDDGEEMSFALLEDESEIELIQSIFNERLEDFEIFW